MAQPNIDSAMEDLKQARTEYTESMIGIKNTEFSMGNGIYNATSKELKVDLTNTGTTVIEGSAINIILDGLMTQPMSGLMTRMYPGDKTVLAFKSASKPASVIVVGPYGISHGIGSEMIASK